MKKLIITVAVVTLILFSFVIAASATENNDVAPALSDSEVIEMRSGDVDSDGKISASDARLALRISAKISSGSSFVRLCADADGNGNVTATDARRILRVSAQLEDESVLAVFKYNKNDNNDSGSLDDEKNFILSVGESKYLGNELIFGSRDVKWKSSNPDAVKVDSDGKITAVKKGFSCIIVTVGKDKYYYEVTVKSELQLRIDTLRNKYPDGYYWNNHKPSSKYPNVTETPCNDHPSRAYKYCKGQCAGFAAMFFNEIHGYNAGKKYGVTWDTVKIGDYIRILPHHSIFIIDIVKTGDVIGYDYYSDCNKVAKRDYFVVAHCNWGGNCNIIWDDIFYPERYQVSSKDSYTVK